MKEIKHKIFITITAKHEIINSFTRINGHIISNGGIERANRYIKTIVWTYQFFKAKKWYNVYITIKLIPSLNVKNDVSYIY